MPPPRPPIASRVLLPALTSAALLLTSCGDAAPDGPPPPSEASLAAITDKAGAPRDQLGRAIDALFDDPEGIGETRALVIMYEGEIAAERYGEGYDAETRFISWSMAKTVTAVMIGMLVADGKLSLDRTPPIPKWQRQGDPRGEITLRQLLQMRSGLRHTEAGDPIYRSSEVRMLFLDGRDDMAAWAEEQPLESRPGRVFEYSTATTVILADVAARVLAPDGTPDQRRRAVDDFLRARLFEPLGMDSATPEYDASGTMIGGSLIHADARDWAKFGEFLRHKGSHRGAQLVPRGWIEFMTQSSPRAPDYGGQTWLNVANQERGDDQVLFPEQGPSTLFAAVGHLGQYVMVSPDQRLTVVRLGKSDDALRGPLVADLAEIVALYPER